MKILFASLVVSIAFLASCSSSAGISALPVKPQETPQNARVTPVDSSSVVQASKTTKNPDISRHTTDCVIKGNISSKDERIYHVPGGGYYGRTEIDESDGERWFCTEEEANAAGWRKSKR